MPFILQELVDIPLSMSSVSPVMTEKTPAAELINQARQLLREGRTEETRRVCHQLQAIPATSADDWNQRGALWFRLGDFPQAASCWRQASALAPREPGYLYNLGLALRRQQLWQAATEAFEQVLAQSASHPDARLQLVDCLQQQGNLPAAEQQARLACETSPTQPQPWVALGTLCQRQGRWEKAVAAYDRSLGLLPSQSELLMNSGFCLRQLGRLDEAAEHNRAAVQLRPGDSNAHDELGSVLFQLGRGEEAIASFQAALRIAPTFAKAWTNLGIAFQDSHRIDEALTAHQRARELADDVPEVHNNLGIVLKQVGRLSEAETAFQRALELRPNYGLAVYNLGNVQLELAQFEQAAESFATAARILPDFAEPRFNLAMVQLLHGDFATGLAGYDLRWEIKQGKKKRREFATPLWNGESLAGRTLFVYSEQGFGDTFQFIRYAPLLKNLGARVVFECRPELIPLLNACNGVAELVPRGGELPAHDFQIPLMSLLRVFETRLDSIPADGPYLTADPLLSRCWRETLEAIPGFRVGIAWQGSPTYVRDIGRSIPLRNFAPLAAVPGVRLISLQLGPGSEQIREMAADFSVTQLPGEIDATAGAFMDTAAILENLDLVISSDTAIVHLAGALGIPCWVVLGVSPDWRWLLDREDSPWYPSLRLFRQKEQGNWDEVFQRVRERLRALAAGC